MPRPEVMHNMLAGENLGIITTRQTRENWDAFATRHICGHKTCAAYDINSLFPLYLYPSPEADQKGIQFAEEPIWSPGKSGRVPNLSPEFIVAMEAKLGMKFVPERPTGFQPVDSHAQDKHGTEERPTGRMPVDSHAQNGRGTNSHGQDAHDTLTLLCFPLLRGGEVTTKGCFWLLLCHLTPLQRFPYRTAHIGNQ